MQLIKDPCCKYKKNSISSLNHKEKSNKTQTKDLNKFLTKDETWKAR